MATTVLRRPLLASFLPGVPASSSRPSCFCLRRCRFPPPVLAVSSDSPKPITSSSSSPGGDNPDEEPVLPLLQELAFNDAVFDLSNGPVLDECGQEVGDLLLNLARAWETADTSTSHSLAKQLPSMEPYLTGSTKSAFGKRLVSAGRRFQSMGQYDKRELKKVSLWQLAQGVQNIPDSSMHYANDNAVQLAKSLKGALLVLGYASTVLSVVASLGLLLLAQQINSENKSE